MDKVEGEKEKNMRLNIFRVDESNILTLSDELENKDYIPEADSEIEGSSLTLYLRKKESESKSWVDIYKDMLEENTLAEYSKGLSSENLSGVLLIEKDDSCFAIVHGQAHFIVRKYCDRDFGLNLAERIADENGLKMKHSQTFSATGKKDITSYSVRRDFDNSFEYGEAFNYVKCKTVDKKRWGENVDFGESACFTTGKYISSDLNSIMSLIGRIETSLLETPRFELPRYQTVKDKSIIERLEEKLKQNFIEYLTRVETEDYWLTGVSFNFGSEARYRLKYRVKELCDIRESLNADEIRTIIESNQEVIKGNYDKIKVEFINENDETIYSKPLRDSMQVSLDLDGKYYVLYYNEWVEFSNTYVKYIEDQVDSIDYRFVDNNGLGETDLIKELVKDSKYTQLHKQNKYIGKYCIEQADLMDADNIIMIKDEHTTSDLVFLIKQATTSVRLTAAGELSENIFNGKNVCLWMLVKRKTLRKLSDFKSFHLLDAINDFRREMTSKSLNPVIWISLSK